MKIQLKWDKPIRLKDGKRQNLIYFSSKLQRIPADAGIYVFARQFSGVMIPLYVGQARNLRMRMGQQLNHAKLMMKIKNSPNGRRFLLTARVHFLPGQQEKKVLTIVERALIKNALSQGHDLLNHQETKIKVHAIRSSGNKSFKHFANTLMLVERGKKK
jgi:hypothetical protein